MPHSANTQPVRPATRHGVLITSAVALLAGLVIVALAVHSTATKSAASSAVTLAQSQQGAASSAPTNLRTFEPSNPPHSQDDPVAPQPPPSRPDPTSRYYTETGHYVSGDFLTYYRANPNGADLFGLPLTEAFQEQLLGASTHLVQYFERVRMEWHPDLPQGQQVQLGALGYTMLEGRRFDRLPTLPSTANRAYFPETGHTLSSGFLSYWKTKGGLRVFGYPISEEMGEGGLTVQYFERARFEYHKDLVGTPYAVQLSPVGYYALKEGGRFNIPMATLVWFEPTRVAEGHTMLVEVAISAGMTVSGQYEGNTLLFKQEPERGIAWAMLGAVPFADLGQHAVTIKLQNGDGGSRTVTRTLQVVSYPFPSESLQFDPETSALLDPKLTNAERVTLNDIFAGRTPEQYWDGPFRMPLDGKIRITSAFATRRCYNCLPSAAPTTYHGGMDMAAPQGSQVHAPAAGLVVFAGKLAVRGNAVIVDHGMGVFSLFAHNSKLLVTPGQMVKKGDVISLSGNTGLSNGPHLHWELHVSGPSVEPLEWVNRSLP